MNCLATIRQKHIVDRCLDGVCREQEPPDITRQTSLATLFPDANWFDEL